MQYKILRYPSSQNKSLQAWNAADEYILKYIAEENLSLNKPLLFNDRFGYLSTNMHNASPLIVIDYKSQKKAIKNNAEKNNQPSEALQFNYPLNVNKYRTNTAIIKVPKSINHFELYLQEASKALTEDGIAICGFMTKYFTPQILALANKYFHVVAQTLAWKKSRLLLLKEAKDSTEHERINTISYEDIKLEQYYGVFSSERIDIGSLFLMEVLTIESTELKILDLASGNGILGLFAQNKNPEAEIHLLDDAYLAVESSKLNLKNGNVHYHFNDTVEELPPNYFDLIISNPPFHFGHETNIEVSIELFKQSIHCLSENGRFCIVANKHLNYSTHLRQIFSRVASIESNEKFEVIECRK